MTPERKNELFDKMLEWIYEHIKDEEELFRTLHDRLGFTKEEANDCSIESLDHLYNNLPVIQRFNEKIATRFDEYKAYWQTLSPKELFDKAEEIYRVVRLAEKLPKQITEAQAEYFLQFVDPLEVISGTMIENNAIQTESNDEEITETVNSLYNTRDGELYYDLETDIPEMQQSM